MDKKNNLYTNRIATFVKRPAKGLNEKHLELLNSLLPKYSFNSSNYESIKTEFPYKKIYLEIGFGNGEHLYNEALNNPDIGYIGAEPYIKGMVNILKRLQEKPLNNIKLIYEDARNFLDNIDKPFLNKIYILFPDPWPKKKHHKRRIVTEENLNYFKNRLKLQSQIIIATDHEGYKEWIKEKLADLENKLNFSYELLYDTPLSLKTKYQMKAEKEGRSGEFYILNF